MRMNCSSIARCLGILVALGLRTYCADAQQSTFVTFDAVGSIETVPSAINAAGVITGHYRDTNGLEHGFVRATGGMVTSFDAPGALGTSPSAINAAGLITGYCTDENGGEHGFVRSVNGKVTIFDALSSSAGWTEPYGVNESGVITGAYSDSKLVHGFVRSATGTITRFDIVRRADWSQTYPTSIDTAGMITGFYQTNLIKTGGFVRAPDGSVEIFNLSGVIPTSINSGGVITGEYSDADGARVFLRTADGEITTFVVPGSLWVFAQGINPLLVIAGWYTDATATHGFLQDLASGIITFDVPGAVQTSVSAINPAGVITGEFRIAGELGVHGFLRVP